MKHSTFNAFYKECKKIPSESLKLSDCRLIAIIDGLPTNSLIPLASANYADGDTLKNTSVSLDALKRLAYVLYDDFATVILPIEKTDKDGKKYIAYQKTAKTDKTVFETDAFSAKILKGDIKRPSSASSTPSASSASSTPSASLASSTPSASSADNGKEEKIIAIVGKLSDYVKNNLKVTNEQLAKLESEFMKILDDNI